MFMKNKTRKKYCDENGKRKRPCHEDGSDVGDDGGEDTDDIVTK